jgi:4-diphosphocytidyl-2-C-methyl-D-erythritol kinase
VTVRAFAKLNLSLRVLGRRADGYHDIDALTVLVTEPYDVLEFDPADELALTVAGPYASDVPADASNLAMRAAELLNVRTAIRLHKGVPAGAGLGGGSADAAAVLRTFCADPARRDELAARLGSDVPFFVRGVPAHMRGRGEVLEPASVPELDVVIATPPFRIATSAVYEAWDALGGPHTGRGVWFPGIPEELFNDLEPAAERVEPALREFRARFEAAAEQGALLCGSGSSYAALFFDASEAREAAARAQHDIAGISTWVARTVPGARSYLPC